MRAFVVWLAVILSGLAIGVVSGAYVALAGKAPVQKIDGWELSALAGSKLADPYTRAAVSRVGLLALTRQETLYFNRFSDDEGRPLQEGCDYRLDGQDLPARWWSVTLYAEDNYLAVNGDKAASFDATRQRASGQGGWSVFVGDKPKSGAPWISNRGGGKFSLTLRLYNPAAAAASSPATLALPHLVRLGCRSEGA